MLKLKVLQADGNNLLCVMGSKLVQVSPSLKAPVSLMLKEITLTGKFLSEETFELEAIKVDGKTFPVNNVQHKIQ
jgi:hypothetical protein